MANEKPQNLQNHVRLVPAYHMFVLPVLFINIGWAIYRLVKFPISFPTVFGLILAVALLLFALYARLFALAVQDRVIRLEMRLRMHEICPGDLNARFAEFTPGQLVALRFASDAELPTLARKVLDDRLQDRKAIKLMVKDWQADNFRA